METCIKEILQKWYLENVENFHFHTFLTVSPAGIPRYLQFCVELHKYVFREPFWLDLLFVDMPYIFDLLVFMISFFLHHFSLKVEIDYTSISSYKYSSEIFLMNMFSLSLVLSFFFFFVNRVYVPSCKS